MKSWNQLTKLDQYSCIYSDMHKDAYGYRPRIDTSSWTLEMFEDHFEVLAGVIEANAIETEKEETLAVDNFKTLILKTQAAGAEDELTALRWLIKEECLQYPQDVEHWVWKQGFLFTDYGKRIVNVICEMLFQKEGV